MIIALTVLFVTAYLVPLIAVFVALRNLLSGYTSLAGDVVSLSSRNTALRAEVDLLRNKVNQIDSQLRKG